MGDSSSLVTPPADSCLACLQSIVHTTAKWFVKNAILLMLCSSVNSASSSRLLSGWLLEFLGGASKALRHPAVGYPFQLCTSPHPPHLDSSQPYPLSAVFPRGQAMPYLQDICPAAVSCASKAISSFCPLSKQLLILPDPHKTPLHCEISPPHTPIQSRPHPPLSHFSALHKDIYHFRCSYCGPCLWHLSASGEQQ